MNKRLVYFFIIAGMLMTANALLIRFLAPPPPQPVKPPEVVEAAPLEDPTATPPETAVAPAVQPPAPAQETKKRYLALGSADPRSEYSLLAIVTNQGAAIHTVELNDPNFRDLDDRHERRGHFGNLALTASLDGGGNPNGAIVGVVGAGTPAAAAGLRPGDVIVGAAMGEKRTPITSPGDWLHFIYDSRVGKPIELTVRRAGVSGTLTIRGTLGESPLEVVQPEYRDPLSMLLTLQEVDDQLIRKDAIGADYTDTDMGVQLGNVAEGGPAAAAGLKAGDVITRLNDHAVKSKDSLSTLLRDTLQAGAQLHVTYQRDDEPRQAILALPEEIAGLKLRSDHWVLGRHSAEEQQRRESGEEVGVRRDSNGTITGVTFSYFLPQWQLELVKSYDLAKNGENNQRSYHLEMKLQIINHGGQPRRLAYQLDGPTGLPLEGWWYTSKVSRDWGGVGIRDVAYRTATSGPMLVGATYIAADNAPTASELNQDQSVSSLSYIAVDARYFAAALIPKKQADQAWFASIQPIRVGLLPLEPKRHKMVNTTFRLTSRMFTLAPAGAAHGRDQNVLEHDFRLFFGPKQPELLARAEYQLDDLVYYGWFGWVANIMLAILHTFYDWVGNYGVAIVMLTVLVRACMIYVSIKQTKGAQRMQQLQPEIKKINERYKNDYQARTKATQELFRQHNYNPMAGCLPVFIQLPVFIGLYRALMVDVELRQQPLVSWMSWCSNLAAPDMLWNWSPYLPQFLSSETGWLGPYFNLLPVFTIALFIWQQKMFMPPPTDEQQAMQQKMMKYMMVVMGIMFFCVPSGLCIYFTASSLWGIGERLIINKFYPPIKPEAAAAFTSAGKPGANGASTRGAKERQKHKGPK